MLTREMNIRMAVTTPENIRNPEKKREHTQHTKSERARILANTLSCETPRTPEGASTLPRAPHNQENPKITKIDYFHGYS